MNPSKFQSLEPGAFPGSNRWKVRGRTLDLSARPLVMGILNVTPDSFSDGSRFLDADAAVRHALAMVEQGADLIDVGGESSRPGAEAVSAEEELRRVEPVIRRIAAQSPVTIAIDTTKAAVADAALAAGAHIVNDISAGLGDPAMTDVVRRHGAGFVLMHMQGTPRTMQQAPAYGDVVAEVAAFLRERIAALVAAGLDADSLVVDPGIGFGKTVEHNVALLACLPHLASVCGRPVLAGVSRKSFLGRLTGQSDPSDRLVSSLAGLAYASMRGARILRVHDVKESCEVARLLAIFRTAEQPTDERPRTDDLARLERNP